MVGYSRADLEAGMLHWDKMTPPEYAAQTQERNQHLQLMGVSEPVEKEYFRKDGTRIPILLAIATVEGYKDKDDFYSACFIVDLTRQKQTEAALRESEQCYRYLSEALPQIVWICDSEGKCEYFNQNWQEFTGQTIEEGLGSGWQQIVHPEDRDRAMQLWQEALEATKPYEVELRYRSRDNSYQWFLARALPMVNEQEKIWKWFGTSTNINEHKRLEAERTRLLELEKLARAEAEAANLAKDDFVAMVSHDLRSPLNAIIGWSKLLRSRQLDETAIHRALETIERNAKSQAKLLEDLLDISRILRGKLALDVLPVNLCTIITTAVETAYPAAKTKNIHLITRLNDFFVPISGDPNRLQQVLSNLLSNAIKFTPEKGSIQVFLSIKRIPENTSLKNYACIAVTDTGIGIKPEFLPRIFERYQQADSSYRNQGLGLGLAIARHITELHGGTISVTSPGEELGSTFTIQLPLEE